MRFLFVVFFIFDPVPTQPTETEKLSHLLAQHKKVTMGNTHGRKLWTSHNGGTSQRFCVCVSVWRRGRCDVRPAAEKPEEEDKL